MSKNIFNIVTEYVKEQHVSPQVEDVTVHEHGGEKSVEALSSHHVGGNHSIIEDGAPEELVAEKPEEEKDDHVSYYEDPCDVGSRQRAVFVSKWNQTILPTTRFLTMLVYLSQSAVFNTIDKISLTTDENAVYAFSMLIPRILNFFHG